jgi:hypothetical protein
MAKRVSSSKKQSAQTAEVVGVTPVRKTVAPRKSAQKSDGNSSPLPTYERIAERAYYIALSGVGGSETDNWYRAEAELKRELGA